MTQNRLPDCRLVPAYVYQMTVGDVAAVDPWAVRGGLRNEAFLVAAAALRIPGPGLVTVELKEDGWYIDVSAVPAGEKFERGVDRKVYRVKSVAGVECA